MKNIFQLLRRFYLSIWVVGIIFLLVACQPNTTTFNETGIEVAEEFQPFYNQNGGNLIFGFPLTDLFLYKDVQVQYFQHMRLELTENNQVKITPLGEIARANIPFTGEITLENEFRSFYEANGGEAIFGKPITSQIVEGERWVQYFQNAFLEWHPESPPALRVQVGQLGSAQYLSSDAPLVYREVKNAITTQPTATPSRVNITASVEYSILFGGDTQTLYIQATTPDGNAAPNLPVRVDFLVGGVAINTMAVETTLQNGVLVLPFQTADTVANGQDVVIQITVYQSRMGVNEVGKYGLSYKVWWE